jgi:hypothetical protein
MAIHFDFFKQNCLSIMAAVFLALLLGQPLQSDAYSPEQRCTDLGVNCLCSEPMNTTTFTAVNPYNGQASWWNPADSTVKECRIEGQAGAAFTRNRAVGSLDIYGTNATADPAIFAALPSAHINTYVARGTDPQTGLMNVGSQFPSNAPTARRALRYYLYYSPKMVLDTDTNTTCDQSSKYAQLSNESGILTVDTGKHWMMYGWAAPWSYSGGSMAGYDCCWAGPGTDAGADTILGAGGGPDLRKGRWWRIEIVYQNVGGVPTTFQVFWKNVTDNTPEVKVLDSSISAASGNGLDAGWTSAVANSLTRPVWGDTDFNQFRNAAGGQYNNCAGFYAFSHVLYAAWSTNAGQRIGAAVEIEGGTSLPSAPTGLKVQ